MKARRKAKRRSVYDPTPELDCAIEAWWERVHDAVFQKLMRYEDRR